MYSQVTHRYRNVSCYRAMLQWETKDTFNVTRSCSLLRPIIIIAAGRIPILMPLKSATLSHIGVAARDNGGETWIGTDSM